MKLPELWEQGAAGSNPATPTNALSSSGFNIVSTNVNYTYCQYKDNVLFPNAFLMMIFHLFSSSDFDSYSI